MTTYYYIERLTGRTWLLGVMPTLLRDRWRHAQQQAVCYVFDGSPVGWAIARACRVLTGIVVQALQFRLIDVRDEQGLPLRLRIAYQDLEEVQQDILGDPRLQPLLRASDERERFPAYMAKALTVQSLSERNTLWRALLTIQVCAWQLRQKRSADARAVFFLEGRPWFTAIRRYAQRAGVTVFPVGPSRDLPSMVRRLVVTPEFKRVLYRLQAYGLLGGTRIPTTRWSRAGRSGGHGPKIAVEYYGQLNLDRPGCHSDLFFLQQSKIAAQEVLMTFNLEGYPLDESKRSELARHGIDAVAMRPKLATSPDARVFLPRLRATGGSRLTTSLRGLEGQWLKDQIRTYSRETRAFWFEFFKAEGVKVYVSWHRYDQSHCAIADALKLAGGVAAIYQRAYESFSSAETAVMADLFFVYSPRMVDIERQSGSRVQYLVATGYLGDYRFPLLRNQATRLRTRLQQNGAQRIAAFADENFLKDERWHTGPSVELEAYRFLLEQVLSQPWFGLVIKPKTPATLRRRLGALGELLKRAEATGRCFVFEEGPLQGSYPPAAAALAADVMIHGHLNAATAGLDAALAGVPTLLLDRIGWPVSPLYRLGVGRVIFTEWEQCWRACLEHWRQPQGMPGFGDWTSLLPELDPFRDGRAAERMGTYLQWLLEGFRAGLKRETVMANAAERYADCWGHDKVVQISHDGPAVPSTGDVTHPNLELSLGVRG